MILAVSNLSPDSAACQPNGLPMARQVADDGMTID